MRKILGAILCLSLSMVVLGLFQRAAEVARWSQIYGILGETGKANPLEDGHVRERFDALYWEDRSIIPTLFTCFGALTSIFSMAALFIHKREGRPEPMIMTGAPVASDT
jgi:hypothetical protein